MKQFTQNKFLVSLVAVLLLANLCVMVYFFVFKHKGREHEQPRSAVEFVQKKLGLDSLQAKKFSELREQHREEIKPLMEQMQKLKDSFYTFLNKQPVNDSVISALAKKIGDKQSEVEIVTFHHLQKVRALCKADQLPKFDSLLRTMISRSPWMKKKEGHERKE